MASHDSRPAAEPKSEQLDFSLSPKNLTALFFQPHKYFSKPQNLNDPRTIFFACLLFGIVQVMNRIDAKLTLVEAGAAAKDLKEIGRWLLISWPHYWITVTLLGAVASTVLWYVAGWWYSKRLTWSGETDVSLALARRVCVMQQIVSALPQVLIALVQTVIFTHYHESFRSGQLWPLSALAFPAWSCWTSYIAVTTVFRVSRRKAKIWFLVLPLLVYVATSGLAAALYAALRQNAV